MIAERRAAGAVVAALGLLCAGSWLYLIRIAPSGDPGMTAMPMSGPWSAADAIAMFLMWAIMMVAMMLPSVMPMVLLYDRTLRRRPNVRLPGISGAVPRPVAATTIQE